METALMLFDLIVWGKWPSQFALSVSAFCHQIKTFEYSEVSNAWRSVCDLIGPPEMMSLWYQGLLLNTQWHHFLQNHGKFDFRWNSEAKVALFGNVCVCVYLSWLWSSINPVQSDIKCCSGWEMNYPAGWLAHTFITVSLSHTNTHAHMHADTHCSHV